MRNTIYDLVRQNFWRLCLITVIAISCRKRNDFPAHFNLPPIANAGPDLAITIDKDSVDLIGSGTDRDGIIVSYEWMQLSGPSQSTLVNKESAIARAKRLLKGTYIFELVVRNNKGLSGNDKMQVLVLDSLSGDPCAGCWDY